MYKILLIEDDETIVKELSEVLRRQGYACCVWNLMEDMQLLLQREEPHCILLDINLPHTDGFVLCKQIRSFSGVPIIFVTSRNTDMDELCSMTLGGDDFITKPYNISILIARIAAVLKRTYAHGETILTHRGVYLFVARSVLAYEGKECELTKNELRILYNLFCHKGEIVARDDLIDDLWDNNLFIDDNALSVNITRIRAKLKELGVEAFIHTRHRQGYWI